MHFEHSSILFPFGVYFFLSSIFLFFSDSKNMSYRIQDEMEVNIMELILTRNEVVHSRKQLNSVTKRS